MNPSTYSATPFDPTPMLIPGGLLPASFHEPISADRPTALPPVADAHEVLRDVVGGLSGKIRSKRLDVAWRLLARHSRVAANRDQLHRVYHVIVASAVDAARPGGRLTIRSTAPDESAVRIEVEERSPWLRQQPRPDSLEVAGHGTANRSRRSGGPGSAPAAVRTGRAHGPHGHGA